MGKVDPLSNIYEPFAVLFWALDIVLYLPTSDPARQPGITPTPYTIHVLIWSQLIQFSRKKRRPLPPFLSRFVINLWCRQTGNFGWDGSHRYSSEAAQAQVQIRHFLQSSWGACVRANLRKDGETTTCDKKEKQKWSSFNEIGLTLKNKEIMLEQI